MKLNRRQFLEGAAISAASLAAIPAAMAAEEAPIAGTRYVKYANPDEIGVVHAAAAEEDADVVVVGAGMAGFCCAMIIAEQAPEAKVVMIEKMPIPGGNTNLAEINEGGFSKPWDEALAAAFDKVYAQYELTDPLMWAHYYNDNGKISAWLFDKRGVEHAADHFYYLGHTGTLAIKNLYNQCRNDEAYKNLEIRLSNQGIALLLADDHTVTGIQVKDEDDKYYNINCKAVMLATGGMGSNTELLSFYTGEDVVEKCTPYGIGQDGDGHLMVEQTAHGMGKACDPTPMWAVVKGMSLESPLNACCAMQNANVYVNQDGVRFHNEHFKGSFVHVDHAFMNQGRVYSIFSKSMFDRFETIGSDASSFYFFQVPTSLQDELGLLDTTPAIVKADSFEELAAKIDVPVEPFLADIAQYEADALAGTGDSKFAKEPEYMVAFGEPPYYAAEVQSLLMQTNNGIRVNYKCQVTSPYMKPIKGLYAGGINVSGFNTSMYTMGTAQHVATWCGCIAALNILEAELGIVPAEDWYGEQEFQGPIADKTNLEKCKPLPTPISFDD